MKQYHFLIALIVTSIVSYNVSGYLGLEGFTRGVGWGILNLAGFAMYHQVICSTKEQR